MNHVIWVYEFEDGAEYLLLDVGLSIGDIQKLEELHGKCVRHTLKNLWDGD